MLAASPLFAEVPKWQFADVTTKVVDKNPPGIGPIFDYALLDIATKPSE